MSKRPAGAAIDMEDVFNNLKANPEGLSRSVFTSRASDTGKRRALAAGEPHDAAKGFARVQYARASALYDTCAA